MAANGNEAVSLSQLKALSDSIGAEVDGKVASPASAGTAGQVLSTNGTDTEWIDLPEGTMYTGTAPITVSGSTIGITAASSSAAGSMSAADKAKLDGIATGANNYVLPAATASTIGGVKPGTGCEVTGDGTINVTGGGGGFDVDKVYPVGSVYLSMASTDPGALFGGTWSKLEGRFLLTSDGSRSAGDTGGSNDAVVVWHTHTATTDNAGSHNHSISGGSHSHTASSSSAGTHSHEPYSGDRFMTMYDTPQPACAATASEVTPYYYADYTDRTTSAGSHTHSVTVNTSSSHSHTIGSDGSHTHTVTVSRNGSSGTNANMPAYLVVNAWQRTA